LPRTTLGPGLLAPRLLASAALLAGCPAAPAEQDRRPAEAAAEPAAEPEPDSNSSHSGPRFILAAETGEVASLVVDARTSARAEGRELLVYVGASWCEPCTYFHAAAEDGSLDEVFPKLQLLEFDLDRDRERLIAAGYESRLIPLFAVPGPDGRAGPRRTEGGVKGPEAVANLTPRLQALLQAARSDGAL